MGMIKLADSILDKMTLSPDQKAKIVVLEDKLKDDMKTLRKQGGFSSTTVDRSAVKDKLMAMNKQFRESLLVILTPDQQLQFKKGIVEEMIKRRKASEATKSGPPPTS